MEQFTTIWSSIASIGWYALAVAFCLWYSSPYIREKYLRWRKKREEEEYSAKYHKNPDVFQQRLMAVDAARQKMQQEYSVKTTIRQKQDEQEKQKKRQVLHNLMADHSSGGRRLGNGDTNNQGEPSNLNTTKSESLKSEYNPLMGDSTRGYRPPKRSCCRKGGCG